MAAAIPLDLDQPMTEDPARSFTMPARWYLDPEIFEQEKEAIFYRNWHYVSHVSALSHAGDYATLRIADENVLVVRDRSGELNGFFNVCKHRAHELLEGSGNTKVITCPYHAWSYGLDGALRGAPRTDSLPGFRKDDYCLTPVRVEDFCGLVFVNLDPDAVPLAEQAADLADDLRARLPILPDLKVIDVQDYSLNGGLAANWKVVVDNFVECYHCRKAHKAFVDLVSIEDYRQETFGIWSRQFAPVTRPQNSAYDFAPDAPVQSATFWYLWPTTTLSYVPGAEMVQVLAFHPKDLGRTSFAGHRLALEAAPDQERLDYLFTILAGEDQALVESVQRGLKSRSYNQGRIVVDPELSGQAEHALHHFHLLVKQAMEA